MPQAVTEKQLMELVQSKRGTELRVKEIAHGPHRGQFKLKLRTPRRLLTVRVADPEQAKNLVKDCGKYITVTRLDKQE